MFERQAEKFVHVHIRYHLAMVRFWSYCLLPFAAVFFASVRAQPDTDSECELAKAEILKTWSLKELRDATARSRAARSTADSADVNCPSECGWCDFIAEWGQVEVTSDIPYGKAFNQELDEEEVLYMDQYLVHQGQNGFKYKPVMIVIHGGAFLKSSTKTSNWAPTVSKYFAMYGFHVVSLEYRRYGEYCRNWGTRGCPEIMYGAPVHDAMAAVRYLVKNNASLAIDTSKIALFGCSAGGLTLTHLMMMNYGEGDSGNPGYPSAVHAGISLSGGYWKSTMWKYRKTAVGSIPPYMAIHNTGDWIVSYDKAESAIELAQELEASNYLLSLSGNGHCPNVIIPGSDDYEFDKVVGFLVNSLRLCNEVIVFP
eukprot:s341_g22.t1